MDIQTSSTNIDSSGFVLHPIPESKSKGGLLILILFFAIIAGSFSGFVLAKSQVLSRVAPAAGEKIKSKTEAGVKDEKTFRDSAEGKLVKGGIDGEGTHHLERTGGESQNVYLTSSVVNLDDFVGKKVKIYGETFAGQKAGWLMDVGRIEIK